MFKNTSNAERLKSVHSETLTDIELLGLASSFNLADGHAYQDLEGCYSSIPTELPQMWSEAACSAIPKMTAHFKNTFAGLIESPTLYDFRDFKVCPTASNSIDIIGAFLRAKSLRTTLIEPTFDNLALLLRRRGVDLYALNDERFQQAAESDALDTLPELGTCRALFLVNPNNPTGHVLDAKSFSNVVEFCARRGMTLLMDNSFRLFNRQPFDDYSILQEAGVSFVCFEDTGKAFPTQDMKASLLFYSEDNQALIEEIYNEIYLCVSNFSLNILSRFMDATSRTGLAPALWQIVDERRIMLRNVISGSALRVAANAKKSPLGVEWLDCGSIGSDLSLCRDLRGRGLVILPGRYFFWNSSLANRHHQNVRISLLKDRKTFVTSLAILREFCAASDPVLAKSD
jgi:aspartate/methionine/tyrosine aminotransferase